MKPLLTLICAPFRLAGSITLIALMFLACLLCAAWDAVVMGEGEEGLT